MAQVINNIFGHLTSITTPMYCDNQATLRLATDNNYHARTKHIDIHFHYICQTVTDNHIKLKYCPTDDMTANILMKPLPKHKIAIHMQGLGLCHA